MKKIFFIACVLLSSLSIQAQSCCTASGCSNTSCSDNSINGLASTLGVRYMATGSRFYLPSIFGEQRDIRYTDVFQSVNFSGRWTIKDRISLQADIPFAFNQRKGSSNAFYTGLGDINFGLVGQSPTMVHRTTKHRVFVGFMVQAPTGEFHKSIDTTGFAPLIQPGFGAWLFSPSLEYALSVNNFGASVGGWYRYALANADHLQIGGRTQVWLKGSYTKQVAKNRFVPSLAVLFDWMQQNKFHSEVVDLSGGYMLSTEVGLDVRLAEQIGIGFKYRQPLYEQLVRNRLQQSGTVSLQFNYFFKQQNSKTIIL